MKIRQEQLDAIRRPDLRPFIVDMMAHLRAHFPGELAEMPDWLLGETLEECALRACSYGLRSRRDHARFLALATCLGWSFDTELEWPAQLLRDPTSPPGERIARVYERCLERLEQQAEVASLGHELRS